MYGYTKMSFNRRPKRIAGPGFHINVRYDDEAVAQMRTNTSVNEKLAVSTSAECYDIKEMELLVTKKESAMYHDGYTHCFSMLNGYTNEELKQNNADVEESILDDVRFVGVAVTEYKPSKAYSEQGFVAQVGGVVTLLNESGSTIYPGSKVKLGVDLSYGRRITRDKGIPREKIRFCIKPADEEDALIDKAKDGLDTANTAGLKKFLEAYRSKTELVIGKSLGLAHPGDRVEVLLQPRHSY